MVFILWAIFQNGDHGIGSYETAKVIDMAMGVIADNAVAQPNGVGNAKLLLENAFIVFLGEAWISDLNTWMEQTFL